MTTDLIAQAEAALDGVTPGPWEICQTVIHGRAYGKCWVATSHSTEDDDQDRRRLIPISGSGGAKSYTSEVVAAQVHDDNDANARFIAWCRAGVPALIARIRELEGERDGWRAHWQDVLSAGYAMKARAEAAEKANRELGLEILAADEAREEAINRRDAAEAKLAEAEKERDAFRAVLEGAQYGDLDGIAKNTREQSFALGEAVMGFTIQLRTRAEAAEAKRNESENILARMTLELEAAEAKLAEVEKERDEAGQLALTLQAEAESLHEELTDAQATVATLTAQVEAMRVSAMKAMTIANGALDPTATEKTFRRDLVQIREELRGALWPAALTTENQTNG